MALKPGTKRTRLLSFRKIVPIFLELISRMRRESGFVSLYPKDQKKQAGFPTCLDFRGGDEGIRTLDPHVANVGASKRYVYHRN